MAPTLLMKTASQGEVGWLVPASRLVLCGRDRSRFQPLADKLGSAPHSCSGSRPRSPNPGVGRAAACWRLLPAPSSIILASASMAEWISSLGAHLCPSVLSL